MVQFQPHFVAGFRELLAPERLVFLQGNFPRCTLLMASVRVQFASYLAVWCLAQSCLVGGLLAGGRSNGRGQLGRDKGYQQQWVVRRC